jgi:thiol-disulfide isomerase/thioredoxin
MSKKLFALLIISCCCTKSFCQATGITIGEKCPDVMIPHIINYKTDRAAIGDFKGKLLILDFWATWCSPCVSMLSVTDSLQKQFEGKIQILAVTDQDEATVNTFFKNMMLNRNIPITIASVTGDRELNAFFPHAVIPHYVWLDENSKVIAITGAEQVTADVINDFINKKETALPVKTDIIKTIDDTSPMFVTGNELIEGNTSRFEKVAPKDVLYHSVITKYIDGFGCEQAANSEKITCKNSGMGDLYRVALGDNKLVNMQMNSTIWEVTNPDVKLMTDSAAFLHDTSREEIDKWMNKYTWCYELKFPGELKDKKFDIMLADLNNYFGAMYNIIGSRERRKVNCLALTITDKNKLTESATSKNQYAIDGYHLQLKSASISELLGLLSINLDRMPPLIDETNEPAKLDIDLNCKMSDVKSINNALAAYGLQLVEKMAERDMIVIKDKPHRE